MVNNLQVGDVVQNVSTKCLYDVIRIYDEENNQMFILRPMTRPRGVLPDLTLNKDSMKEFRLYTSIQNFLKDLKTPDMENELFSFSIISFKEGG